MDNNENLKGVSSYKESHGTGVLSTMIFMVIAVAVMIILKNFLG